jgi:tetratricopeptide (TPR) repeat protein
MSDDKTLSLQLSLPEILNREALIDWNADLRKHGVPKQVICNYLLTQSNIKTVEYFLKTEYKITDIMAARNLRGKQLEKTGNTEEAIKLYETNVTERFTDNLPYDRLRVIYTNQKHYAEAIRVCEAFVEVANSLMNVGTSRDDLLAKRARYLNYIERLEQAKNRGKSA